MPRSTTVPVYPISKLVVPEHRISKTESSPARAPAIFGFYSSLSSYQPNGVDWDSIKSSSVLSQTSNVVTHHTEPRKNARQYWESKCWEMRDRASSSGLPVCRERDRRLLGSLAIMIAAVAIPTLVAATDLTPHLRIGCGFTSVTSAVSLIPLRRDERAGNAVLIPMYALSLTCSAVFILLQYVNIVRHRNRVDLGIGYLFGTFILSSHFLVGLIQTSDNALEGIVDFGPVVLPLVAAVFSLLFQRRRVHSSHAIPPEQRDSVPLEEIDIAVEGLRYIGGNLAAV